ncbi:MAG: transketolase [Clostridia bacterium]|nr:transketolase [Clostridia bacterium]
MDSKKLNFLKEKAKELRITTLKMIHEAGSGHPGGSLSEIEILTTLYYDIMNVKDKDYRFEDRDRFVLSKGHCCPPLYAICADKGYFSKDELMRLRKYGSILHGHPKAGTPGVETVSGSLGNGLSVGMGMAMAFRKQGKNDIRVFVLCGDGELQEGAIWEAAMCAAHNKLNKLTLIVDHNKLQINGQVDDIVAISPLKDKFEAFGWNVIEADGHDFEELEQAFKKAENSDRPTAILAETIKGKGVSFMENNAVWHGKAPNAEELEQAIAEIRGE